MHASARDEAQMKIHTHPRVHEAQKGSPASAESSPPLISRLKPRSQVPSPSSVGFSMHRIALALAASASAKHYMMQSKRLCFDRLFVNCLFRQRCFRRPYSSSLRQTYMKALETDEDLQLRILNVREIFSMRIGSVFSTALKRFFLRKWKHVWFLRSNMSSEYRVIGSIFYMWSRAVLVKIMTRSIADQNRATPNVTNPPSVAHKSASTALLLQNEAWCPIKENSGDFKRIVSSIQFFDECFCCWKRHSHKQFSRRTKFFGVISSMQRLAQFFAYRGCYFKGRTVPIQVPANLEAGTQIDFEKCSLRSAVHIRSAYFIMWAEQSPPRQVSVLKHLKKSPSPPSKEVNSCLGLQNVINLASPIIMAGTPPAFPTRQSPFQNPDFAKANRIPPSHILEEDNCSDADSYAAAVLMDHHQSLCDQSVCPAYQPRNLKGKPTQMHDLQNLESTLLNSIGDISGDSDSLSETSGNPFSGAVFTTTLRPQSPSTKAHIRNNIILPSWGDQGPARLQRSKHSSDNRQVMQKIQAFKMVRSPPLAPLQDAFKDRKSFAAEQ